MLETFNITTTARAKELAEDGAAIFKKI